VRSDRGRGFGENLKKLLRVGHLSSSGAGPFALGLEKEFAKQLRLARYLAASSLPPSRPLEPVPRARAPKQGRTVTKAGSKAKAEAASQKAGEAELVKERRRAGQVAPRKAPPPGQHRDERQRSAPGR
jgi:hypothetical protein